MPSKIIRPARRRHVPRRTFLRGLLGGAAVSVSLPLLDVMLDSNGTALAQGSPMPRRFGVFYWGGGIVHDAWVPETTGTDWVLPDSLQPFANVRDAVTLVTGTNHHNTSPGHIPSRGIALSSSHDMNTSIDGVGTYRGQNHPEPSVDALVAEHWSGLTPFDSIEIGICRAGPYKSNSSWKRGGSTYNRHEPSPQKLFQRLFSGQQPDDGGPSVLGTSAALNKSMLDVVMEDANSLSSHLGASDRMRMEQHLEGLRAIERRLVGGGDPRDCTPPSDPGGGNYGDGGSQEQKEAKSQIMSDLLAMALACDMSRIFSYEWSATQSNAVYWEVGIEQEHHQYNHDHPRSDGMRAITRFIMQNYAYLAQRLRDMPEGDGNVLDNTLILGTSEHATAGNHDYRDHPFLLVGKAGGAIRAGMHHRDPNPGSNTNAPKVLLTAVRAVGVDVARLGQADSSGPRRVDSTITEIET